MGDILSICRRNPSPPPSQLQRQPKQSTHQPPHFISSQNSQPLIAQSNNPPKSELEAEPEEEEPLLVKEQDQEQEFTMEEFKEAIEQDDDKRVALIVEKHPQFIETEISSELYPMQLVINKGRKKVFDLLIDKCNLQIQTDDEMSLLDYACMNNDQHMMRELSKRGLKAADQLLSPHASNLLASFNTQ